MDDFGFDYYDNDEFDSYIEDYDADEYGDGELVAYDFDCNDAGNSFSQQTSAERQEEAFMQLGSLGGASECARADNISQPGLSTDDFWKMVKTSCESKGQGSSEKQQVSYNFREESPFSARNKPFESQHNSNRVLRQPSACVSLMGSDVVEDSGEGLVEAVDEMLRDTLSFSSHPSDSCADVEKPHAEQQNSGTCLPQTISEKFLRQQFQETGRQTMGSVADGMQSDCGTSVHGALETDAKTCSPTGSVTTVQQHLVPKPQVNVTRVTSGAKDESDSEFSEDDNESDESASVDNMGAAVLENCPPQALQISSDKYLYQQSLSQAVQQLSSALISEDALQQLPIYNQTQDEMDIGETFFVKTSAFEDACDILADEHASKKIFLLGLPGSGKQTIARALMRNLEAKGYFCTIVKSAEQWENHVFGRKHQVIFLPHIVGELSFSSELFEKWERHFDLMSQYCKCQKNVALIFSLCPHIFGELKERKPQFFDSLACVRLGKPDDKQKQEMLVRHLESKGKTVKEFEDRISKIIATDLSDELFPGYCQRWAENLDDVQIDEIFQHRSVMYCDFFSRLIKLDQSKKEKLVASFSLLLKGVKWNDSSGKNTILQQCNELGFPELHSYSFRDILKPFTNILVSADYCSFANREAYDGVALAIGADYPDGLVQVADWQFLVQRCRVPERNEKSSSRPHWPQFVIIERLYSHERIMTTPYLVLVERLIRGLQNSAEMIKACQHKVLQALQFTNDLSNKISDQLLKTLCNTDNTHNHTLFFWSIFNSSKFFSEWIYKTVLAMSKGIQKHAVQSLAASVILCCVFNGKTETLAMLLKYWKKSTGQEAKALLQGQYSQVVGVGNTLSLPLPSLEDCLNESWKKYLYVLEDFGSHVDQLSGAKDYGEDRNVSCIPSGSSMAAGRNITITLPPLHVAVISNNTEAVSLLTKYPETLQAKDDLGHSALHVSAFRGHEKIVRELLTLGAGFSKSHKGNTPLHEACFHGSVPVVNLFLSTTGTGASDFINDANKYGETPLFLAVASGNKELVHLLLRHGAKEDVRDVYGNSLLHAACRTAGNVEIVQRYLETTDVNEVNNIWNTPLHVACHCHDDDAIVKLLIENRADVNASNVYLSTPLHTAAMAKHMKIFYTLINSEADLRSYDLQRKRAYHYLPEGERRNAIQMCRLSASE